MSQTVEATGVFQLPRFIAWLETMPPEKKYVYSDYQNCLVAQYLKAQGWKHPYVTATTAREFEKNWSMAWTDAEWKAFEETPFISFPSVFNQISLDSDRRTFGGALKLAKRGLEAERASLT
jgi:hypothetical protein